MKRTREIDVSLSESSSSAVNLEQTSNCAQEPKRFFGTIHKEVLDPGWRVWYQPNNLNVHNLYLHNNCNLIQRSLQYDILKHNDQYRANGQLYKMRSVSYKDWRETNECKAMLMLHLKEVDNTVFQVYEDKRNDSKRIRDMITDLFMIARAVAKREGMDERMLLLEGDGEVHPFFSQVYSWMQSECLTHLDEKRNRVNTIVSRIEGAELKHCDAPIFPKASITVGEIHDLHTKLMSRAKTMKNILSATQSFPNPTSIYETFVQRLPIINAKVHTEACEKLVQHLDAKMNSEMTERCTLIEDIFPGNWSQEKRKIFLEFFDWEHEFPTKEEKKHEWDEIRKLFILSTTPPPSIAMLPHAYYHPKCALLGKSCEEIIALCPVPTAWQMDRESWCWKACRFLEEASVEGDLFFAQFDVDHNESNYTSCNTIDTFLKTFSSWTFRLWRAKNMFHPLWMATSACMSVVAQHHRK